MLGPNLGLVKSSSLESLHNVMHHSIKRDLVYDGTGTDMRSRSTRSSFIRAVNHSYQVNQSEVVEQRGVDGKGSPG